MKYTYLDKMFKNGPSKICGRHYSHKFYLVHSWIVCLVCTICYWDCKFFFSYFNIFLQVCLLLNLCYIDIYPWIIDYWGDYVIVKDTHSTSWFLIIWNILYPVINVKFICIVNKVIVKRFTNFNIFSWNFVIFLQKNWFIIA